MEKLKNHLKKHRVIYLLSVLFVSMIIVHIVYNVRGMYGDDATFYRFFPEQHDSLVDYLVFRYNNWTSRMSVEAIMFLLINNRVLFSILDSLMYVLLAYSFYRFFDKKSITLSVVVTCLLPYYHYVSVGLYAGSVNYTWPIAFLMFGLIFIKKIVNNQKLNAFEVILLFFSFVFVSFVEICAVLMFVFMVIALVYHYIKNKKISPIIIISALIAILGIVFMLLSPGNSNRANQEIRYFPEYANYNIVQKLTYGLVFVANANSLLPCALNIIFSVLIVIIAFKSNKGKTTKIFAIIPLAVQPLFYVIYTIVGLAQNNLNFEFITYANILVGNATLKYIICLYACVVTIFTFLAIIKNFSGKQRIFLIIGYILSVGLIGSFGLNGSISFYADYRPTIFSCFILSLMVLDILYSLIQNKTTLSAQE